MGDRDFELTWKVYCDEIRPMYLIATKGYGFSVDDIDWSCPADLKPYIDAHQLVEKSIDEKMWVMGIYVTSAVRTSVEQCLAGSKAKSEYLEEPLSYTAAKKTGEVSESQKARELDRFLAEQNAMRLNWKRTHEKAVGE